MQNSAGIHMGQHDYQRESPIKLSARYPYRGWRSHNPPVERWS